MEGRVELSIERYEELTKLERDGNARVAELEANMDTIIVKHEEWCNGHIIKEHTNYKPKSKELQNLVDQVHKVEVSEENAVHNLTKLQTIIEYASFSKRWKYLWTSKLE